MVENARRGAERTRGAEIAISGVIMSPTRTRRGGSHMMGMSSLVVCLLMPQAEANAPPVAPAVAWTIAGSDAGGGAGIQADLKTFESLGVHGCCAITALTAQNSHEVRMVEFPSRAFLRTTLETLRDDMAAGAIKLGMLGSEGIIGEVAAFLAEESFSETAVVCDPVMVTTSGARLLDEDASTSLVRDIFPRCALVTPNIPEAEALLSSAPLATPAAIEEAAEQLLLLGCRAVLIKGGHSGGNEAPSAHVAQDYFADGASGVRCWLTSPRLATSNTHGTGCTLSSAIAALLARGLPLLDAIVLSKAYVTKGIACSVQFGAGPGPVAHTGWPQSAEAMPWISSTATDGASPPVFARCTPGEMSCVLPVVDSAELVHELAAAGAAHVQLRLKDVSPSDVQAIVNDAQEACKAHGTRLWVNDHWRAALAAGAYGVHVGQEDLEAMGLEAVRTLAESGLRLGVSTHSYAELATALAVRPSYISLGPVYETKSKDVSRWEPQGLARVQHWRQLVPADTPLVAIGGISLERAPGVIEAGADGIAAIGAITKASDRAAALAAWSSLWNHVEL